MTGSGRAVRPSLPPASVSEAEALAFGLEDVAAVREAVESGSGEPFAAERLDPLSCTVLTTAANEPMRVIHDRMPVVIPPESFAVWFAPDIHDAGRLSRLLRPFHPDEMTAYPVSTLVNSVKNDSPKLVALLPPTEKQARLFSPDSSS